MPSVLERDPFTRKPTGEHMKTDEFILELEQYEEGLKDLPRELRVDAEETLNRIRKLTGKSYILDDFKKKISEHGCIIVCDPLYQEKRCYLGVSYDKEGRKTQDTNEMGFYCPIGKIKDITSEMICKACC